MYMYVYRCKDKLHCLKVTLRYITDMKVVTSREQNVQLSDRTVCYCLLGCLKISPTLTLLSIRRRSTGKSSADVRRKLKL